MTTETRGGKTYYYRSVRYGGRVVKEYVPSSVAEYAARLDRLNRQQAASDRAQIARWDALDRTVSDALGEARRVVDALLVVAGYHRHDRGAWRKKRGPMSTKLVQEAKAELAARGFAVPEDRAERIKIVRDALDSGKKGTAASPAIACIRAHPTDITLGFWNTTEAVILMAAGDNRILQEILLQEAKGHEDALLGESPTQLERLLVDRIVACGLQIGYLERDHDARLSKGMSLAQSESCQKRIDRAHKQHLSAIKTLAQVRKLQLPTVSVALPGSTQVNVGEKQINVAQTGADQVNLDSDS